MSPNERRKKLFEYLEIIDEWTTIKELSNNLEVSERTIHTDIEKISESLIGTESAIEKKRGVGVRLLNHIKIENSKPPQKNIKIDDRKIKILDLLLIQNKVVSYNDLSKLFFVSPTSIKNDIEEIKKKLDANTNVKIISNINGTKIQGDEVEIREALIWLNQYIIEKQTLMNKSNIKHIKQIFKQFYIKEIIDVAYDILFNFVKKNNSLLADYYFLNTLNVYIVQIHRLTMGKTIDQIDIKINTEQLGDLVEFTSGSSELLKRASSRLSLNYSKEEVSFLAKHLILNRFEVIPSESIDNQFIEELLNHLSVTLDIDFKQDKQLMKELNHHVPPMIYRLKLGVRSDNPFVEQIKNEFGQTFHIIWLAINNLETRLDFEFNDDEVALLTIYFQSAIERQRTKKRILVVCQYGIATSELLVNRLKNELSATNTIESASIGELEYFILEDFDLVISSTDELQGENVVNVPPFLNAQNIEYIKGKLDTDSIETTQDQIKLKYIYKYLNAKYIFSEAEFESREELLCFLDDKLVQGRYVQKNYTDSLIHRESIGNTDLPEGIAIPHGDIQLVNKSLVILINNKKKIRWNKYFVDKFFILVINKEDIHESKKIMKELYAIINNENTMVNFIDFLNKVKEEII